MSSAHGSSRMRGHSSHNLGRHLAPEKPHELIPDYYAGSTGISNWNGLQLSGSACNKSTSFLESSLSSNMSSGTVPGGRRSLSHSHSGSQGWTSGTGSELSYDDVTEFDRQASAKVKQMFDDINNALYDQSTSAVKGQMPISSECAEWQTRFLHLRVVGSRMDYTSGPDDEFDMLSFMCHYPPPLTRNDYSETLLEDVTAEESHGLMSPSLSDVNKLQIQGKKIKLKQLPKTGTIEWNALYEEVIVQDGNYEEYIVFDSSEIEATPKKDLSCRQRRFGLPPVTPNACVRDTAVSQLFDRSWSDILLTLRPLLDLYKMKVLAKEDFAPVDSTPTPTPDDVFSQTVQSDHITGGFGRMLAANSVSQLRFRTLSYGNNSQSSGMVGDVSDLHEVMTITHVPLRQRQSSGLHQLGSREGTPSTAARSHEATGRLTRLGTGHLLSRVSDHQLPSTMRSFIVKPKRVQMLKPLERSRTPLLLDDLEVLRGHRLQTGPDRLGTPSTPIWGGRNHPLPPIENTYGRIEQSEQPSPPQRKSSPRSRVKFSNRISSAAEIIENNRILNLKFMSHDSRPNTTHASPSDFDVSKANTRRSSTPHSNAVLTPHSSRHGITTSGSSPHKGLTGMSLHPQMRENAYNRSMVSHLGAAGLDMLLTEEDDETDVARNLWPHHTQGQQNHFSGGRKQRSTLR